MCVACVFWKPWFPTKKRTERGEKQMKKKQTITLAAVFFAKRSLPKSQKKKKFRPNFIIICMASEQNQSDKLFLHVFPCRALFYFHRRSRRRNYSEKTVYLLLTCYLCSRALVLLSKKYKTGFFFSLSLSFYSVPLQQNYPTAPRLCGCICSRYPICCH